MDTIIQDIFRWSIGFVIVSTLYLALVWWLGRRLRAARKLRAAAKAAERTTEPAAVTADRSGD